MLISSASIKSGSSRRRRTFILFFKQNKKAVLRFSCPLFIPFPPPFPKKMSRPKRKRGPEKKAPKTKKKKRTVATCMLCLEILAAPVMCTCGQSFCQACIVEQKITACPHCRISPATFMPNRALRTTLQSDRDQPEFVRSSEERKGLKALQSLAEFCGVKHYTYKSTPDMNEFWDSFLEELANGKTTVRDDSAYTLKILIDVIWAKISLLEKTEFDYFALSSGSVVFNKDAYQNILFFHIPDNKLIVVFKRSCK